MSAQEWRLAISGPPVTKKNTPQPVQLGLWGGKGMTRFLELLEAGLVDLTHREPGEPMRYYEALAEVAQILDRRREVLDAVRKSRENWRLIILPNEEYRAAAGKPGKPGPWLRQAVAGWTGPADLGTDKRPVWVEATYYLPARKAPDLLSLHEATADLLQAARIVKNDFWIKCWDGADVRRDPDNPRTELVIRPFREKGGLFE